MYGLFLLIEYRGSFLEERWPGRDVKPLASILSRGQELVELTSVFLYALVVRTGQLRHLNEAAIDTDIAASYS